MKNYHKFIGILMLMALVLLASCSGRKNSASEPSPPSVSNEWDKIIDDYEKFVESYSDALRKAITGSASEDSELEELDAVLGYWISQFYYMENQLTEEQEERLGKISQKLTAAIMDN